MKRARSAMDPQDGEGMAAIESLWLDMNIIAAAPSRNDMQSFVHQVFADGSHLLFHPTKGMMLWFAEPHMSVPPIFVQGELCIVASPVEEFFQQIDAAVGPRWDDGGAFMSSDNDWHRFAAWCLLRFPECEMVSVARKLLGDAVAPWWVTFWHGDPAAEGSYPLQVFEAFTDADAACRRFMFENWRTIQGFDPEEASHVELLGPNERRVISTSGLHKARYEGHLVLVTSRWSTAGGVACRVRRHPEETDWPWTVEEFTTAETALQPA